MLVADVIMWFLVIVGILLAFPSLWLLCRSLYPKQIEHIADGLEKSRLISFFIGVPIAAVAVFAVAVFGGKKNPFCDMAAISTIALFLFYSNIGVAGLATMIGRKLPSPADLERPWKGTIRGGAVLVLSFLLPILGWFFILPISLIVGSGALTACLLGQRKTRGAFILQEAVTAKKKNDADEVVGAA